MRDIHIALKKYKGISQRDLPDLEHHHITNASSSSTCLVANYDLFVLI